MEWEGLSTMARFLLPNNPWTYDYDADALDGDVDKVAFAEPVPDALRHNPPRVCFGGGAPVSSQNMPTKLRLKGRKRGANLAPESWEIDMIDQVWISEVLSNRGNAQ